MVDAESTSATHAIGVAVKYMIGFAMLTIQLVVMFGIHVVVGAFDFVKDKVTSNKETVDETPEDLYNYESKRSHLND